MKKLFLMGAIALASLGLCSCDEASKLAEKVDGTWAGAPERLIDSQASSATTLDTYTFTRDGESRGGKLRVVSLVSTTGSIMGSAAIVQPFSLTAAATAQIDGTWLAIDDDEIQVNLDLRTLQVNVDPDAVVLSSQMLTGATSSAVDSLKPSLVNTIDAQVRQAISNRYLGIKKLDDVEVKGNLLEMEIGHNKYVLNRQ